MQNGPKRMFKKICVVFMVRNVRFLWSLNRFEFHCLNFDLAEAPKILAKLLNIFMAKLLKQLLYKYSASLS